MTYNELTYKIRGCVFEVYNQLGPGLLESIYEKAMIYELQKAGLSVKSQVHVPVVYKDVILETNYILDILVEDAVIIELKSVEKVLDVHKKQLLTYLKITNKKVGYLINFNDSSIVNGMTRIVNGLKENDKNL